MMQLFQMVLLETKDDPDAMSIPPITEDKVH